MGKSLVSYCFFYYYADSYLCCHIAYLSTRWLVDGLHWGEKWKWRGGWEAAPTPTVDSGWTVLHYADSYLHCHAAYLSTRRLVDGLNSGEKWKWRVGDRPSPQWTVAEFSSLLHYADSYSRCQAAYLSTSRLADGLVLDRAARTSSVLIASRCICRASPVHTTITYHQLVAQPGGLVF